MRNDNRFDAKKTMDILNRGFNCKYPDKGKVMILNELREAWPNDRRSVVNQIEGGLPPVPFNRREREQGRGGVERRVTKDRRGA